jgi:hypothetical protein
MLEPDYKQFCITGITKLREPAKSGQLLDAAVEDVIVREAVPDVCTELTLLDAMTLAEAGDPEYMKVHIVGMQNCSHCCDSSFSNAWSGQTATNHNRCLFMTAADFFGRLRAAQALTEDFDGVVAEFGRGCPCKNPPLKSKGKAHLNSTTHDKAFNRADGKFFGLTVRAALELPVDVVIVQGAQRIEGQGAGDGGDAADPNGENNEFDAFDEMEQPLDGEADEARPAQVDDADEDLSDIVVEDP